MTRTRSWKKMQQQQHQQQQTTNNKKPINRMSDTLIWLLAKCAHISIAISMLCIDTCHQNYTKLWTFFLLFSFHLPPTPLLRLFSKSIANIYIWYIIIHPNHLYIFIYFRIANFGVIKLFAYHNPFFHTNNYIK